MSNPAFDCLSRWLGHRCEPPSAATGRAWPRSRYEWLHTSIANLASVAIVVTAIFGAVTTFVPFERESVLKLNVEDAIVGGVLKVNVDYCVGRSPLRRLNVTIRNGITVVLSDEVVQFPEGCRVTQVRYPLSSEIPPGTYRLSVYGVVQPWPWRSTAYAFESPPFKVNAVPYAQ